MAMTDLRSMLLQVTSDPAMLRYLDLGQSTGKSPNENYSRELMELFTMGAGNFTEDDVRSGAKALAGWVEPKPTGTVTVTVDAKNNVTRKYPVWDRPLTGLVDPKRSYPGPVTFLGKERRVEHPCGDRLDPGSAGDRPVLHVQGDAELCHGPALERLREAGFRQVQGQQIRHEDVDGRDLPEPGIHRRAILSRAGEVADGVHGQHP